MPPKRLKLRGREIATGLAFPEGPVAMPDGSVLVVEIAAGNVTRIGPNQKTSVVAHVGGGPNGLAIGPGGLAYVCNNGGLGWHRTDDGRLRPTGPASDLTPGRIEVVNPDTGKFERLFDRCDGLNLNAPNDLVFDDKEGLWFTDLGKARGRQSDRGSVFYADAHGAHIREQIHPISLPNGIGLAADQKTLYVTETETARLWRYDIGDAGILQKQAWPSPNGGDFVYGHPNYGRFDSLAVEADGNICVATLIEGGISVISPTGKLLEFWETPDRFCTNICFGGPDMQTAFITLSETGKVLAVDWPRSGQKLAHS